MTTVAPYDRWGRRAAASDEGSATVLVLSLTCVVVLVATVLVALGAVAVARHRAGSAADLAALAAASRALQGQAEACALAGSVAGAGGARLVRCALDGATADVVVEVSADGPLAALGPARAGARAGPAVQERGPR